MIGVRWCHAMWIMNADWLMVFFNVIVLVSVLLKCMCVCVCRHLMFNSSNSNSSSNSRTNGAFRPTDRHTKSTHREPTPSAKAHTLCRFFFLFSSFRSLVLLWLKRVKSCSGAATTAAAAVAATQFKCMH